MNTFNIASVLLVQALVSFSSTDAANILFFHHVSSYSHIVATWPLAEALANRGHQVSYISPYKYKQPNPNITEFLPKSMEKFVLDFIEAELDVNTRVQDQMVPMFEIVLNFGYLACEALYSSPDFNDWLTRQKNVDLVIVDSCGGAECGIGLAHKLGAKYINFNTVAPFGYEYDALGWVPETSAIPDMDVKPYGAPMGFFARVSNAIKIMRWRLQHVTYSLKIDNYIRNTLQMPDMPYIGDLLSKVSLVFNPSGDAITDYPRALPPNVINVAGMHCKEGKKALPQNIENFISAKDKANDGFVYISLGSVVVSSNLPENIKKVFFDTVKSFPNLKFLWKWNGDFPKEIPENLLLSKWFPQMDLLGHPNIRAFVTQSGRPSVLEALFNGVSMISFPILGDQDSNAQRLSEIGAAVKLEIGSVTLEEFKEAIKKSVYDPSTKIKLRKYQKAFRDRPMSPVDTAVWWTEYVLRTENTEHLRAAGVNQNWFVRRQIDVWAFLSISVFAVVISSLVVAVKISRKLFKSPPKMKQT